MGSGRGRLCALAMGLAAWGQAQAAELEAAKPESVGLSSERLGRLDAAVQADVASRRLGGAVVAVARRGKVVQLKAYGKADVEAGVPMRTDHLFRLYSSTKPMISVALLMLYEEGKFQLTDPVEKYIPEFAGLKVATGPDGDHLALKAPDRKPTVQDVFRHTAGFPGGIMSAYGGPVEKAWLAADFGQGLPARMQAIAKLPLLYEPGTDWRYGPEHEIQAYLIEKLSGMPLEDFLRTRLFGPLKMTDTGYTVPADKLGRLTVMYGPDGAGGLKAYDRPVDSAYLKEARFPRGGTGLTSTVHDELRFGQMLLNGGELDGVRILSRKTVEMMLSDQLPAGVTTVGFAPKLTFPGMGYGLGIGVMGDVAASGRLGSAGTADWPGFGSTDMWIDRKEQMVIVAFDQFYPTDMNWLYRVQTLVYQALAD
jgi:CubicO group peptidase (beta-lactamase class C family)